MRPVWIGCSGWDYDDWRGVAYPEGLARAKRLRCYAETFATVEVNASFYRLPEQRTVANWCEQVPDGFSFSFKASRYLTHVKRLRGIGNGIRTLNARLRPARESGKLGPLLWQLPPDFAADDERLERLQRLLELLPEGRHAIELRHPSWFRDEVYELLSDAGVALVVADDPEHEYAPDRRLTTDWAYVRLHRGRRGRRGNYSDSELETWKRRVAAWRRDHEVFLYLNNDWEGFAPRNAATLAGSALPGRRS